MGAKVECNVGDTIQFNERIIFRVESILPEPPPEPTPEQERCYGCELLLLPEGYHKQRWSQIHLCFKPVCIRCFNSTDDNHSRIDSLKCGNEGGQAQGLREGQEIRGGRP